MIAISMAILQTPQLFAQSGNNIVPWASGFTRPVEIANCGDNRLFVVCKAGTVFIVDSAGNKKTEPFLDIEYRVKSTYSE